MSHRKLVTLAAVAAFGVALAACGGEDETATATGEQTPATATQQQLTTEPITLRVHWWGDQEVPGSKQWFAQTARMYTREHPNIQVKLVLQSTDGLVPGFKAACAAKEGPDIQYMWGGIWTMENVWNDCYQPIEDLVGAEEVSNYRVPNDITFDGKVQVASWYLLQSYPVYFRRDLLEQVGLEAPPEDWAGVLEMCDALRAEGITPFAGGLKDGFFAGALFVNLQGQTVSSPSEFMKAVAGEGAKLTDPPFADWWSRLQEMRDRECWNDDINSQDLYAGQQLFRDGKAAMTIAAGTAYEAFVKDGGGDDNVGVAAMPAYGDGPFAGKLGATAQTLGVTSFAQHPVEAADFIKFLHTPERMNAFFEQTGALPADKRFDTSQVSAPQQKELVRLTEGDPPGMEDFIPTELDFKSVYGGVQRLFAGEITGPEGAQAMEDQAQRLRRVARPLFEDYLTWANSLQ